MIRDVIVSNTDSTPTSGGGGGTFLLDDKSPNPTPPTPVYVVYGHDTGTGGNQREIRRITTDGSGTRRSARPRR